MSNSGQKFVARNRAPRVQIEYDVELYGAEKKVQLPFVMGVMSDLAGKSNTPMPSVNDRKFLEIDVDNFDDRLKSIAPRAAFAVPNTLTGEGNLAVDLTFEKMEDFSPAAIAKKVAPLQKLLDARTQLAHLSTYMDGKTGAEELMAKLIADPAAFAAMARVDVVETSDNTAALDDLRAVSDAMPDAAPKTGTDDALAALAATAVTVEVIDASTTDALADLAATVVKVEEEDTSTDDALAALAETAVTEDIADTSTADALSDLAATAVDVEQDDTDTDNALATLAATAVTDEADDTDTEDALAALAETAFAEDVEDTSTEDALADLAANTVALEEEDDTADALDALREVAVDLPEEDDTTLDDALADLAEAVVEDEADDDVDLSEMLAIDETDEDEDTDLDTPLGDDEDDGDLDDLLSDDDAADGTNDTDLDALPSDSDDVADDSNEFDEDDTDLDDLLSDDDVNEDDADLTDLLANDDSNLDDDASDDEDADLGALPGEDGEDTDLSDLLSDDDDVSDDDTDLDDLLADDDDDTDLDDLLGDDDDDADEAPAIEDPFGSVSLDKPTDLDQSKKFRIAIMGDFSGRASRGEMETGADLAKRKPIKFDIDNIDAVIARFATTLVLPIGADGAGVEVKLNEIDDLHPDELYDNVDVFAELSALRQRVAMGDGAKAIAEMQGWANEFGDLNLNARPRAKGTAVPADRKLSDFQSLIGDMQGTLSTPSPAEDLIGRIVGPFVQAAPDPAQDTMLAAIDEALSGAMRAILHHPDFQAVESTWRALDLIARRINTGAGMDVVLYDVSAEEWAADLSAQDDLSESGLFQMLAEEPRLDEAQGALSIVFGLYTLEETPPHAELLARMSKISEWMNAPFMTSISPKFLETPKADRHPLVAKTWDMLRGLPSASFIGLTAPRFLLRLPYGAKTEPVDPFNFEEFTMRSGLKGMLWANPVVLSAILLAETVNQKGKDMKLGDIMSLGDMPFHYMTDQYGDQVALPCTERLLNTRTAAEVIARGFIPLLSIKGRNEVRQGSFQSVGAGGLAGPWGLNAAAAGSMGSTSVGLSAKLEQDAPEQAAPLKGDGDDASDDDDDFSFGGGDDDDGGFDLGGDDDGGFDFGSDDAAGDDGDLDDLLSGFGDDDSGEGGDDDMDPELAAMLEGL